MIHTTFFRPAWRIRASSRAVSSSRPSAGPSPLAMASQRARPCASRPSGTPKADRHVRCNHLPRGARRHQFRHQPFQLRAAEEGRVRALDRFAVVAVRAPEAAHIEHEHVEQRALGDAAMRTLVQLPGGASASARSRGRHAGRAATSTLTSFSRVARIAGQVLRRGPVVGHLRGHPTARPAAPAGRSGACSRRAGCSDGGLGIPSESRPPC